MDQQQHTEPCCGEGGEWIPDAGSPQVLACQLCPASSRYWRNQPGAQQRAQLPDMTSDYRA